MSRSHAGGAVQAVRETGRNVLRDVWVAGFDDIPYAEHTEPPPANPPRHIH